MPSHPHRLRITLSSRRETTVLLTSSCQRSRRFRWAHTVGPTGAQRSDDACNRGPENDFRCPPQSTAGPPWKHPLPCEQHLQQNRNFSEAASHLQFKSVHALRTSPWPSAEIFLSFSPSFPTSTASSSTSIADLAQCNNSSASLHMLFLTLSRPHPQRMIIVTLSFQQSSLCPLRLHILFVPSCCPGRPIS